MHQISPAPSTSRFEKFPRGETPGSLLTKGGGEGKGIGITGSYLYRRGGERRIRKRARQRKRKERGGDGLVAGESCSKVLGVVCSGMQSIHSTHSTFNELN